MVFGTNDDAKMWAGYLTGTDADSGMRKWQFKAPAPITSGVTPTSGRLVLFGDMAGTFYALDALNGTKLLAKDLGGAIGGGVIVYDTNQGEKIAVAVGMVSSGWPVPKVNGKVVVLWPQVDLRGQRPPQGGELLAPPQADEAHELGGCQTMPGRVVRWEACEAAVGHRDQGARSGGYELDLYLGGLVGRVVDVSAS